MGWLIALAVLCVLAILPIGFRGIYCQDKPGAWLLIGPIKIRLYPKKAKGKSAKKDAKTKDTHKKNLWRDKHKIGGSARDFIPILRTVLAFAGELRHKMRIRRLELRVTLAGEEPDKVAINYGRTWAALGNFLPHLENLFVIKKRSIHVDCDFAGENTRIYARVDATITVARAVFLVFRYGKRIIKDILNLKNLQEGGAGL